MGNGVSPVQRRVKTPVLHRQIEDGWTRPSPCYSSAVASWLNPARIRRQVTLLAVCLWLTYAVSISTPGLRDRFGTLKGVDFLQFYTAGRVVLSGKVSELYHLKSFAAESLQAVPAAAGMIFAPLYPPQVGLLFAPFTALSYGNALLLWSLVSVALYAICCWAVWRACPSLHQHRLTVLAAVLGYPAFFNLVAYGQISALALGFFSAAFFALRARRPLLAGLALGMLIYKPPLIVASALVLLLAREWTAVTGMLAGAGAQFGLSWAICGTDAVLGYGRIMRHVSELTPLLDIKPYQMHSLRALWSLLLPLWPTMVLYAVCALMAVVLTVRLWRSPLPLAVRYSGLLLATVLVAPHLYVYDLVILAPALLLLTEWDLAHERNLGLCLYLAYALPLLGPLVARYAHLQLSVIAFAALLWRLTAAISSEAHRTAAAEIRA